MACYTQPSSQNQRTGLDYGSIPMQTDTNNYDHNNNYTGRGGHSSVQVPPTGANSPSLRDSSEECVFDVVVTLILFVAFYYGIMYAFGNVNLQKIEVNSFSVTCLNVSHSQISANWNMTFLIEATWRKYYDRADVSVYYKNEFLSGTVIGPIQLDSNGQDLLQANLAASSKDIPNSIADSITTGKEQKGTVSFNVNLLFSYERDQELEDLEGASCRGLDIEFSSDSTMGNMLPAGKSRKCKILDRWHQ